MANFESAISIVLQHEGGYVNDPVDPGGATNYGVSLRFLRATGDLDLGDVDGDGDIDADDIRQMNRDQAIAIYRSEFWDRGGYEHIRHQNVANKLFDAAVNMGPKQAHKLVQRALWSVGRRVVVDGQLGPRTLAAIQDANGAHLLAALRSEMAGFYRELIARRPQLKKYRKGWERRAYA
ncbi:MAG: hypothetical protein HQL53_14110 [Magnetococcales bacterium]|nr:hypothetical protein [Magnetococcales bacterium]